MFRNSYSLNSLPIYCLPFVLMMAGCSSDGAAAKNQMKTVPVSGAVQVDGKPVGSVNLTLATKNKGFPGVAGSVAADGRFSLMTYKQNDGAPIGKYLATLSPNPSDPSNKCPEVEPLTVEISKADSNLVLDFKGTGKQVVNPLAVPPSMPRNPNFNKGAPNRPQ